MVSRILAHLRLSIPNLSPICFAIPPVVIIATVLLAVHTFTIPTNAAILSSALRLVFICLVMSDMTTSIPPFTFISSSIPPAIIVMTISSPIPLIPSPMAANHPKTSNAPSISPMTPVINIPRVSTAITFIPHIAVISTTIYGNTLRNDTSPTSCGDSIPAPITP